VSSALRTNIASVFRRTALPLASYYAVTLALPLANGAGRSGRAFVEHALFVLAVPPIVIVVAAAVRAMCGAFRLSQQGVEKALVNSQSPTPNSQRARF
jgi:hypothetical protein